MSIVLFENQTNATLTFQTHTHEGVVNPYLEPETTCHDYVVELSIEEGSVSEINSKAQRKDLIELNGRLVLPRQLPVEFKTQRQARITVKPHYNSEIELTGTAYILPQLNSRLGLEAYFGEYIQLEVKFD